MEQYQLKYSTDNFTLYTYKGFELDDSDVPYLLNNQLLYLCQEGTKFSNKNYLNHLEFTQEVKSTRSGVILLAKNLIENNQILLVKRIQLKEISNDNFFSILKESRLLEAVKHSHVCNTLNTFIYENKFYIVMFYYKGGDLNTYLLERKILEEKEAKLYIKQLLEAVRFYQRKGIVHRNLSPMNILFSNETKENLVVIY